MMHANTLIMAIAMLLYNMTAPLVSGIPQGESHDVSVIAEFMHSTAQNTENTETIRLAENEANAPNGNDKSRAASEKEIGKSASESGSGKSEQSKKAKSKPLEPFVPSEEIAAEQAVDFPVDI